MRVNGEGVRIFSNLSGLAKTTRDGVLSRDDDVFLAGIPPLRAFFAKWYGVQRGDPGGALLAGGLAFYRARFAGLLLSADRQGHVFRRGRASFRQACGGAARRARGDRHPCLVLVRLSRLSSLMPPRRRRSLLF